MKKFANYTILPEYKLILECCKGRASVDDAVNMKKRELSDDQYNPKYNIIVDFRELVTTLDSSVKASTTDFFHFLRGLEINCKIAILTMEPHQVVISLILKELSTSLGAMRMEVFSTAEAATRFLGIPAENLNIINSKISELNKATG